uniref:(California timema) hypothetical protein n=1 Tax=Timema californicum TaxID=61474 RepID=A0A7R9IW88_TIMCA|nr:unnamed protein product [Timema californicum]
MLHTFSITRYNNDGERDAGTIQGNRASTHSRFSDTVLQVPSKTSNQSVAGKKTTAAQVAELVTCSGHAEPHSSVSDQAWVDSRAARRSKAPLSLLCRALENGEGNLPFRTSQQMLKITATNPNASMISAYEILLHPFKYSMRVANHIAGDDNPGN